MGRMGRVATTAILLGGCGGPEVDGMMTFGGYTSAGLGDDGGSGSSGAVDDGGSSSSGVVGDDSSDSGNADCTTPCTPGAIQTEACPDMCAQRVRTCNDDCTWGVWGTCEDTACQFVCQHAARNGSEICDDEGLDMPNEPLFLYCEDDNGGVAYVSNNTGPVQMDGVARCQGWEDNGQNAWDHLDYVHQMDCDTVGKYLEIQLPAGTQAHFGVHDQPGGGGHFTQVCIATLGP